MLLRSITRGLKSLSRRDMAELLDRVAASSGPVAANRLRAALSALWTWGLRRGLIEADSNPVSFTLKQVEKPRERTLTDRRTEGDLESHQWRW